VTVLTLTIALAAEGMWQPDQLPALAAELAAEGLAIPAEQLADISQLPLSAVVGLGWCTASFVSDAGLFVTNHHCVTDWLSGLSDETRDLHEQGWLAETRADELYVGPGKAIQIITGIEDVTETVVDRIDRRMKDAQRQRVLERTRKELVATCEEATPGAVCQVISLQHGLVYQLVTAIELKDIRLVYVPPRAVGDYGGEVDNWEWPRHAGDFSILRAWVGPSGNPEHGADNVPYRPSSHLTVSTAGVAEGDFVMVAGYPASTERYRLASELDFAIQTADPTKIAWYGRLIGILETYGLEHPEAAGVLGGTIDGFENSIKAYQGELVGFEKQGTAAAKHAEEGDLRAWMEARKERKDHLVALDELRSLVAAEQATWQRGLVVKLLRWMAPRFDAAHDLVRWNQERALDDLDRDEGYQDRDRDDLAGWLQSLDEGRVADAERLALTQIIAWSQELPTAQRIEPLDEWLFVQGGVEDALDRLYGPSVMDTPEGRTHLLDVGTEQLAASTDPWVELALAMAPWLAERREEERERAGAELRLRPLVMEARLEQAERMLYPDANGTLRVTYGQVRGYEVEDGLAASPHTRVAGLVAKAGEPPFDAPEAWLAAAEGAPRTRWADPHLRDVPVDFLSTLDTTGGNSGSPTLNAQGELVGLLFDGTYESIPADWDFDDALTRSIHVDVRYLLWILDEVEGADHLVEELGVR